MKIFKTICSLTALLFVSSILQAQEEEIDRWDNWLLVSNKVVLGGKNSFKHSHELQWRVNNNMSSLKEWYYEGVFTYSPNKYWEITPDFRASVKPDKNDFRFGIGGVKKTYFKKKKGAFGDQLVQQLKYQLDIDSKGNVRHGVRYVLTYNHIVNKQFIVSGLAGPFYRFSEEFTGIEFIRGGPVLTYAPDLQHTIAFAPLFGAGNLGGDDGWAYSFTPMISLLIRIGKEYKYTPAKYINF